MLQQNNFTRKEVIKSPAVWLFLAVYIFAVGVAFSKNQSQAFVYIGLSIGILFLIWLIVEITKNLRIYDIKIKTPSLELAFGFLIILIIEFAPLPRLDFGDNWMLGTIVRKFFLFFFLPFIFLRLRKNSFSSMGFSSLNWKQNLRTGLIIFLCMAAPSAFFVSNTANLILNGKLSLTQVVVGFLILFIHNVALSGFVEEFLYRAFIQSRISQVLKSKLDGVLITSLLFGLIHISDIMQRYSDITLAEAFCRTFFLQGFSLGIVLGMLWARTHNLIPGVIVHSGINALNSLGSVTSFI